MIWDPDDHTKTKKIHKLLRQVSMRQLHNDLNSEVSECTSSSGARLVSGTGLCANVPPEVRPTSDRYYIEMFSYLLCLRISIYQKALNRFRCLILDQLEQSHHQTARGSSKRRSLASKVK